MAVTSDIIETWRNPRAMISQKLILGVREDRALATLIGGCLLVFIAQWPGLARAAHADPSVPLDARLGGALLACVFLLPLLAYALAGLSHLAARAFGGRGSAYSARIALFWALVAASPLMLLHGLARGLLGPGLPATLLGVGVLAGFVYLWVSMLIEAER